MAWRKWLRGSLQQPVVFWGAAQQHVPTRVEEVGPLEGPEHSMLCVVEGEDILVGLARSYVLEDLATEPSVVVRLARKELAPIMAQHPSTKDRALEKLAANQRWQSTMISSLATRPPVDRLVLRLIDLADSFPHRSPGPRATPRISQTMEVPHASVMPYVDALLTHGGMSTVATALAFGVPMVCSRKDVNSH